MATLSAPEQLAFALTVVLFAASLRLIAVAESLGSVLLVAAFVARAARVAAVSAGVPTAVLLAASCGRVGDDQVRALSLIVEVTLSCLEFLAKYGSSGVLRPGVLLPLQV